MTYFPPLVEEKSGRNPTLQDAIDNIEVDWHNVVSEIERPEYTRRFREMNMLSRKVLDKDQIAVKRDYLENMILPDAALQMAREYIAKLGLSCELNYGDAKLAVNFYRSLPVEGKPEVSVPGMYKVPVDITDDKGTTISEDLYVEASRRDYKKWEVRDFFGGSPQMLQAKLDRVRSRYIILQVRDEKSAFEIAESLYNGDRIRSVQIWDQEMMDSIQDSQVLSAIHGMGISGKNLYSKIKPEEAKRRELLRR